jgi:GH25 family lysozyme M1 (1,4-beta-N-acetylmuramidase)
MALPNGVRRDGVDISHYQSGPIHYGEAKRAGVRFVCHKATEGTTWTDDFYHKRRADVYGAGLLFGAYHFARPGSSSGKAQAEVFLKYATPKRGDMWPMLDLEVNDGMGSQALTEWARDWVETVMAETGERSFIYTQFDLGNNFDCPLWRARYSDSLMQPVVPKPWKRYAIWQFSDGVYPHSAPVTPGVGRVDCNHINSEHPGEALSRWTIGGDRRRPDDQVPVEQDPKADPFEVIRVGTDTSGRAIKMTRRMKAAFDLACDRAKVQPTIVQGAFNAGVSASAGTHDLSGAIDLRSWDLTTDERFRLMKEARLVGWAAWYRTSAQGFDPHMHWVLGGEKPMHPATQDQWQDYLAGRNGLAGDGRDDFWRPDPIPTFKFGSVQEDDMFEAEDRQALKDVQDQVAKLAKAFGVYRVNDRERAQKQNEQMNQLEALLEGLDAATPDQVARIREQVKRLRQTVEAPTEGETA